MSTLQAVHFARKPVEPVTRMVLSLKHPATLVASMAAMAIDYFYRSMRRCALPCATYSYIYLLPIFVTHQSRRGRGEERFLRHLAFVELCMWTTHALLCTPYRSDGVWLSRVQGGGYQSFYVSISERSENHFGCSCPAFKEMGISHFLVSISERSGHHFDIHESDTVSRSVGRGRGIGESGKEGSTSTIGRRGA